jgi:hypothetical protein
MFEDLQRMNDSRNEDGVKDSKAQRNLVLGMLLKFFGFVVIILTPFAMFLGLFIGAGAGLFSLGVVFMFVQLGLGGMLFYLGKVLIRISESKLDIATEGSDDVEKTESHT